MRKLALSLPIILFVMSIGCTKDTTSNCGTTTYKYSTDVSSILTTKCNTSGCHNSSSAGGLNLTSYTAVKDHSSTMRTKINNNSMPPSGSPALTSDEKTKILSWIDACSPNN